MLVTKITLEDTGQDLLELFVNDQCEVIEAGPFQNSVWGGATIPVTIDGMVRPGELCPIHNPPHIIFGLLRHKVEKVERVEY